jgi:hypothetical protein
MLLESAVTRREYSRSIAGSPVDSHPNGRCRGSRVNASGSFTRMPTRLPYALKEIPASQLRRSSLVMPVDVVTSFGMDRGDK